MAPHEKVVLKSCFAFNFNFSLTFFQPIYLYSLLTQFLRAQVKIQVDTCRIWDCHNSSTLHKCKLNYIPFKFWILGSFIFLFFTFLFPFIFFLFRLSYLSVVLCIILVLEVILVPELRALVFLTLYSFQESIIVLLFNSSKQYSSQFQLA